MRHARRLRGCAPPHGRPDHQPAGRSQLPATHGRGHTGISPGLQFCGQCTASNSPSPWGLSLDSLVPPSLKLQLAHRLHRAVVSGVVQVQRDVFAVHHTHQLKCLGRGGRSGVCVWTARSGRCFAMVVAVGRPNRTGLRWSTITARTKCGLRRDSGSFVMCDFSKGVGVCRQAGPGLFRQTAPGFGATQRTRRSRQVYAGTGGLAFGVGMASRLHSQAGGQIGLAQPGKIFGRSTRDSRANCPHFSVGPHRSWVREASTRTRASFPVRSQPLTFQGQLTPGSRWLQRVRWRCGHRSAAAGAEGDANAQRDGLLRRLAARTAVARGRQHQLRVGARLGGSEFDGTLRHGGTVLELLQRRMRFDLGGCRRRDPALP